MAVVRSPDFLRALIRETALATLIHQRRLTQSCGGQAPTAERTVGPARIIAESLTPKPGIREQYLPTRDIGADAEGDLPQQFRTIDYVRDWLPIRREQCAKHVSRKSRWWRSSARRIASRWQWWPSGTGSASRRSTHGASVSGGFRRTTSDA